MMQVASSNFLNLTIWNNKWNEWKNRDKIRKYIEKNNGSSIFYISHNFKGLCKSLEYSDPI